MLIGTTPGVPLETLSGLAGWPLSIPAEIQVGQSIVATSRILLGLELLVL